MVCLQEKVRRCMYTVVSDRFSRQSIGGLLHPNGVLVVRMLVVYSQEMMLLFGIFMQYEISKHQS